MFKVLLGLGVLFIALWLFTSNPPQDFTKEDAQFIFDNLFFKDVSTLKKCALHNTIDLSKVYDLSGSEMWMRWRWCVVGNRYYLINNPDDLYSELNRDMGDTVSGAVCDAVKTDKCLYVCNPKRVSVRCVNDFCGLFCRYDDLEDLYVTTQLLTRAHGGVLVLLEDEEEAHIFSGRDTKAVDPFKKLKFYS